MKKFFATILLSVLFSVVIINTAFAEIMLFVGDGCSHCANVEKYMQENNVLGRLPVKVYEVWNHPENQPIYLQKAEEVGYTGQGVPLMVDGPHYEVGDYPIISYFTDLLEKQTSNATSKLEEESTPVIPEEIAVPAITISEEVHPEIAKGGNTMAKDDSVELNEIIEEKTDAGEKSELKDPSTLYNAANGVDVTNSAEKKEELFLKSPLFYGIVGFVIVDIIIALYIIKRR
ncbi:MAG: hypothetical protein WCX95_03700 [Candidatus Gracilibacteria bacterium]